MYPNDAKLSKQFKYADKRNVPYVVLLGDEELRQETFIVKDMQSGVQETYPLSQWEDFVLRLKP